MYQNRDSLRSGNGFCIISQKLIFLSKQVPVVTMIGPRQSGKTTLVKKCFPEYNYVNLEDAIKRMLSKEDYKGFFLNTYVEKDLRELLEIKNLDKFLRFFSLYFCISGPEGFP